MGIFRFNVLFSVGALIVLVSAAWQPIWGDVLAHGPTQGLGKTAQRVGEAAIPNSGVSQGQFVRLMRQHIRNVEKIGVAALEELKRRYPGEYDFISEMEARAFLRLHDQAKVNRTGQFLAEHHLSRRETFAKALAKYYGAPPEILKNMPGKTQPTEWDELRRIVDRLNDTDAAVVNEFLKNKTPKEQQALRFLEKLSDCLDTSMNRKAEFNAKQFVPASEFFRQQLQKKPMPELGKNANRLSEIARYFEGTNSAGVPRLTTVLYQVQANRSVCLWRLFKTYKIIY